MHGYARTENGTLCMAMHAQSIGVATMYACTDGYIVAMHAQRRV